MVYQNVCNGLTKSQVLESQVFPTLHLAVLFFWAMFLTSKSPAHSTDIVLHHFYNSQATGLTVCVSAELPDAVGLGLRQMTSIQSRLEQLAPSERLLIVRQAEPHDQSVSLQATGLKLYPRSFLPDGASCFLFSPRDINLRGNLIETHIIQGEINTRCSQVKTAAGKLISFSPETESEELPTDGLTLIEIPFRRNTDPHGSGDLSGIPDISTSADLRELLSGYYGGDPGSKFDFKPGGGGLSNPVEINLMFSLLSAASAKPEQNRPVLVLGSEEGISIEVIDGRGHQWQQSYTMEQAGELLADVEDGDDLLSRLRGTRLIVRTGKVEDLSCLCWQSMETIGRSIEWRTLLSPMQLENPFAAIVQTPKRKKYQSTSYSVSRKKTKNKKKTQTTQDAGKDSGQQQSSGQDGQGGRPPVAYPTTLKKKSRVRDYLTIKMGAHEFQIDKSELSKNERGEESPNDILVYQDDKPVNNVLSAEINSVPVEQRIWCTDYERNILAYLLRYGTDATINELMNFYPVSIVSIEQGEISETSAQCKNDECSICNEHFITQPYIMRTACNHFFHLECMKSSVNKAVDKKHCPLCRASVADCYEMLSERTGEREQQLHLAVKGQNEDKVRLMLAVGADVDHVDGEGDTAIHTAIRMNHSGIVRLLMEHGADLRIKNRQGLLPKAMAEKTGNSLIIKYLNDPKALFYAIRHGRYGIIHAWLNAGHNPNTMIDDRGMSLLQLAVFYGHAKIVELLLSRGSRIDHIGKTTALIMATRKEHIQIVDLLLERGADVNAYDANQVTPLMVACSYGRKEIVTKLLERGARLDIQTKTAGQTALMKAVMKNFKDIVKVLLDYGAQDSVQAIGHKTALIEASASGYQSVVSLLLEYSPLLNHQDMHGMTALMWAAQSGHTEIVNFLLEKNALVNLEENNGKTALGFASFNGHGKIMAKLLEKGAEVNLGERPPLHLAAFQGHNGAIYLLLDNGADINQLDRSNQTALMAACHKGHKDIVTLLLERGADTCQKRAGDGATALDIATLNGHPELCDLLKKDDDFLLLGIGSSGVRTLTPKEFEDMLRLE